MYYEVLPLHRGLQFTLGFEGSLEKREDERCAEWEGVAGVDEPVGPEMMRGRGWDRGALDETCRREDGDRNIKKIEILTFITVCLFNVLVVFLKGVWETLQGFTVEE